jgi:hypothetical protein
MRKTGNRQQAMGHRRETESLIADFGLRIEECSVRRSAKKGISKWQINDIWLFSWVPIGNDIFSEAKKNLRAYCSCLL